LLLNNLSENHFNGFKNYLFCSNDEAKRFRYFETLDEANSENVRKQYHTIVMPLYQVLLMKKTKSPVIQITKYLNATISLISKWLFKKILKELTTLSVGIMYTYWFGVSKKKKTQEAIKLVYADNDVSIHSLHKIQNTTVKTVRLKFIS
jgi:transcription-repair coupling factor (superfamily II helicase)